MATGLDKVTVLGTGVLGAQIIMQAAWAGKTVVARDINDEALNKLRDRFDWIRDGYKKDLEDFSENKFEEALGRITTETDLAASVKDADIVIEAVPENLDLKREVWSEVGEAAPEHTIFVTNTSSLTPSEFMDSTGRPEKFTTLHFANRIWKQNIGEVMMTSKTTKETFDTVVEFAKEINLVPIEIFKEQPGYAMNSLLIPWLSAASNLYMKGIASPHDIDRVWRIGGGAPHGPFQAFDVIGFNVAAHIHANSEDETQREFAKLLRKRGIDQGKTGIADRAGFYLYDEDGNNIGPNPDWEVSAGD